MKIKNKKIAIIAAGAIMLNCVLATGVHAVSYQSRDGAKLGDTTVNDFATNIRNMEAKGGTLGLTADINPVTLRENGTGNGVDAHMIKMTEWGVAQILTASQYGNKATASTTSTGNASGIYYLASSDDEYVAGVLDQGYHDYMKVISNKAVEGKDGVVDSRYIDAYTDSDEKKAGDGLEFGYSGFVYGDDPVFTRGYQDLFYVNCYAGTAYSNYYSRAALVVGAGL